MLIYKIIKICYSTYWISNHHKMALGDVYISYVFSQSDLTSFSDRLHYERLEDLNLVKLVSTKLVENEKQFFFINQIGTHSTYSERYDSIDVTNIKGKSVMAIMTVLYRILIEFYNKIYNLMDTTSIVYYFSDHGEVIGKGYSMGWLQDYTVPFLVLNRTKSIDSECTIEKYIN